jgi:D-alanyl-D-alanine carboxypeptidase
MANIEATLDDIVARAVGEDGPGALLGINAPLHRVRWQGASGSFARGNSHPLTTTDGFRIASMSKVFTAVLVMRRVERGELELSAPLATWFDAALVRRLHPDAQSITLRHLLNHTAGLWDFALSREWAEEIRKDPERFRPPAEILDWAISHGQPVAAVGDKHVYSDTGYVLLGRLLETTTGESYAALCRREILTPLGMNNTWLEGHEQPLSSLSHCYAGNWDALEINGCLDWAAGGHVSTLADLEKFLHGLFRDKVLVKPATLEQMLVWVLTPNHRYGLGLGIRREFAAGRPETAQTFWGHSGHWGSFMFYVPGLCATVCGTVNRAGQDNRWAFEAVLAALHDVADW